MLRLFSRYILPLTSLMAACLTSCLDAASPASTPSEIEPLAEKSLLLDVARIDGKIVAVGERGHVLISRDEGHSWKQVSTPTRATLTAVAFDKEGNGWAVGHQGVILDTDNKGESWSLITRPDQAIIYLDTYRADKQHAYAVGAYGTYDWTEDGGNSIKNEYVSEMEMHFNHFTVTSQAWYLVGESGEFHISEDLGEHWEVMDSPYNGSLYGMLELSDKSLLLFGLRGRIFKKTPGQQDWERIPNEKEILITDGIELEDGTIILSGMGDNLFVSQDHGQHFNALVIEELEGTTALVPTKDNAIVCVGKHGVMRVELKRLIPDFSSENAKN